MIDIQFYTISQTSLTKASSSIVEEYIPLWFGDGTSTSATSTTSGTTFLQDGGTASSGTGSARQLTTLNSNWLSTIKYAFEATIYVTTSGTVYSALWDITSNTIVSSSQVSITSTTATVVRSSQLALTPGHVYGVTIWTTANSVNIVDASLIVFGS